MVLFALFLFVSCSGKEESPPEASGAKSTEQIRSAVPKTEPPAEPAKPALSEKQDPVSRTAPETDVSKFEQIKPMLKEQLLQQKRSEVLMGHYEELKGQADIETDLGAYDSGDPDTTIAVVNGQKITKHTITVAEQQQMAAYGLEPGSEESEKIMAGIRSQILDNLVFTILLKQKAAQDGLKPTEEQVNQQYQLFTKQFGGEETLNAQLDQQGMTQEDLKNQIRNQLPVQLYIEQYLADNFDAESVVITEDEMRAYYDLVMQQQ